MRIMAIRTGHKSLVHAMLERHRELRAHIRVTRVTQLRLALREQKFRNRRLMNRVAIRAHNIVQRVRGTADIRARNRLRMTVQAVIENLGRLQFRKRDDGGFAAMCGYMRAAGPVATLATGIRTGFVAGGNTLEVRIPIKVQPNVGVTGLTHRATHIARRRRTLREQGQSHAEDSYSLKGRESHSTQYNR